MFPQNMPQYPKYSENYFVIVIIFEGFVYRFFKELKPVVIFPSE